MFHTTFVVLPDSKPLFFWSSARRGMYRETPGTGMKARAEHPGRRTPEEISAEIIRAAHEGGSKTNIMYGARLNYKQLRRYLDHLTAAGLLHSDVRRTFYASTDKGKTFLAQYEQAERLRNELMEKSREIHEIFPDMGDPGRRRWPLGLDAT
jgi:predicted transcriptional regulator